ncbi:MAG: beta-lactamase [Bryobacterales bacterium]|nr:beta-lactamase [Bryobacterales bacterium]
MSGPLTRRRALASALLTTGFTAFASTRRKDALSLRLAEIEKESGGRLGCAVLDLSTNLQIAHRADERFPMCSTFKALASALVLHRVDSGLERLDRRIAFTSSDVVTYSPITKPRAGPEGMTVEEICHAAMTVSDNTAANLLLASFGGPPGLTAFVRSVGDPVTRLDRIETDLNEAKAGDPRDTTTPAAMLENLRKLVLGNVLTSASRATFSKWLTENKTGDTRLRAGFPRGWVIGDKTGSGENGTTNDIAVIWPPRRPPILVAAYLTQAPGSAEDRDTVLAIVGRAVASHYRQ